MNNKKRTKRWSVPAVIFTVSLSLITALLFCFQIASLVLQPAGWGALLKHQLNPDIASIGIIGGADGPTAIYTTTRFSPWGLGLVLFLVVLVTAIVSGVVLYFRNQKEL